MTIDFSNIKEYDGSQDKGFEELVCQLAHLQTPENAVQFIRKEGDGRDAGVVWHTQGSGKNFSMTFLAGNLVRRKELSNTTIRNRSRIVF